MSRVLYIDIETYCKIDLRSRGVYRYAEDPSFTVLMAAWALDDGPVTVATTPGDIAAIPHLHDPGVTKVAHNATFERVCLGPRDPEQWIDTMALAAEHGYPLALGPLAAALGAEEKDSAGTRLINLFSKPYRGRSGRVQPDEYPDKWADFVAYCAQDVVTLRDIHRRLPPASDGERAVWLADAAINDRGIAVDVALATAASAMARRQAAEAMDALADLLPGVENAGSVQQVRSGLAQIGLELPDLTKATVDAAAARDDLTPDQARALSLKQTSGGAAVKKYDAALASVCSDGRLRGMFRYGGAHTGRWAGRGVQLQNLPRPSKAFPTDDGSIAALAADVMLGVPATPDELKGLVRSMFTGPLTVVDYSAIEARVLAWLAGESWVLEAFSAGRDIYVETAERMGPQYSRQDGKIATLALGYQGSVGSLRAMGAPGTDDDLRGSVSSWRAANPSIVRFWARLERAFAAGLGGVGPRLGVASCGDTRAVVLPSGRRVVYHGVRADVRGRLSYLDRVRGRTETYGGRLVENVVQALSRDLLADSLVRLEAAGVRVVGHVHDEVLVEGACLDVVTRVLTTPPDWGEGLPLDAAGFVCSRYRKG